jgi:hypothetical protein
MFSLTKLWQSVGQLAANLSALAETVAEVNSGLRHKLSLDGQEVPLLPHQAAQDTTNGHEEGNGSGKGRRKATA